MHVCRRHEARPKNAPAPALDRRSGTGHARSWMRLAVLVASLSACTSSSGSKSSDGGADVADDPPCDGKSGSVLSKCANDFYLGASTGDAPEACKALPTTKLSATAPVQFFRGTTTTYADVASQGKSLVRYFDPYGLTFVTESDAQPVEYSEALAGSEADIEAAVVDAGYSTSGPYTDEEQAAITKIVAGVLFRNVKSTLGKTREKTTKVVVVERIVAAELNAALTGGKGEIAGLGLSPVLLNSLAADDSNKNLFELMDLPPDFTPTLFIAAEVINRLAKGSDFVIAHEMGHTLGLQHVTNDTKNLMTPVGSAGCQPVLNDEQLAELAKNLALTIETSKPAVAEIALGPSRIVAKFAAR